MRRILQLLICLVVPASGFAQTYGPAPKWIKSVNVDDVRSFDTRNAKEGYCYVLVDEQFNTVLKHDFFHYATKAVSELGLDHVSQIEIQIDPSYQQAQVHFIRIRRGDVVIDRTHSTELRELNEEKERDKGILNESRTLYANLGDVRKGDVVEYAYSITGYNKILNGYFGFDLWFAYSVPVGKIHRSIAVDQSAEISILDKNGPPRPEVAKGKSTTYTWEIDNPPVIIQEANIPTWYDPYPLVQVSNCKDWSELKKWLESLFVLKPSSDAELKMLVDSIKNQHPGVEDQVTAFVDFTQNQIRYSGNMAGIYSHQPHSPDYVLNNRYGDCKDKSAFLRELLRRVDVNSFPVLLHTGKRAAIRTANPSVGEFNHCILAIEHGGMFYYVDPTYTLQGGSFKERKLPDYQVALVLDGKETIFTELKPDTASKISVIENFRVDSDTKNAELEVKSVYSGIQADNLRYSIANTSLPALQESFKAFYQKYSDDIDVVDTLQIQDDVKHNLLYVSEHYRVNKFWVRTDSASTIIEKNFIPYVLNDNVLYGTDKTRKQPLAIPYPVHIQQKISVYLAEGWNVKNEVRREDNDFFSYLYRTQVSGPTVHLTYNYRSKTNCVLPEDYPEYKAKTDFVDSNMVFAVTANDVDQRVFGFNWLLVSAFLGALLLSFFLCMQLYNMPYATPFERKYDAIGGWLVLVAIGLILTPVTLLYSVIKGTYDEMGINYFYYYFDDTSQYYNPLKGYYSLISNALNVFLIVGSIFLIILFFQRKNSFRVYYIGYRIFNVIFLGFDLIMIFAFADSPMGSEDRKLLSAQSGTFARILVQTCIWVPYVWFSERSRHTFTDVKTETQEAPEVVEFSPN